MYKPETVEVMLKPLAGNEVRVYYLNGNIETQAAGIVKKRIRRGEIVCCNAELCNDELKISTELDRSNADIQAVTKWINDVVASGVFPDADYFFWGNRVLLKSVFVIDGEFTIPSFVSGIYGSPFADCKNLVLHNESQITDMQRMFNYCRMESLILQDFDASHVVSMEEMFYGAHVNTLILRNVKSSNVKTMAGMFKDSNIRNLVFEEVDTSSVEDMSHMFAHSNSMGFKKFHLPWSDTSKVTNMSYMFSNSWFTNIDLSNFNAQNVTNISGLFCQCYNLRHCNMSGFSTKNVTNMSELFCTCAMHTLEWDTFNTSNVQQMHGMFRNSNLPGQIINNLRPKMDTRNVTDMHGMFEGSCLTTAMKNLIDSMDTSNVTNMGDMFRDCECVFIAHDLKGCLNFPNLNTSSVKSFCNMFYGLKGVSHIDISNFDTSNCVDMRGMFEGCTDLVKLDLSAFNTSHVKTTARMFFNCTSLVSVNTSIFSEDIEDMERMFAGCKSLQHADLYQRIGFFAAKKQGIFNRCPSLT